MCFGSRDESFSGGGYVNPNYSYVPTAPNYAKPAAAPVVAKPDPSIAAGEAIAEELRRKNKKRGTAATIISGGLGDPNFGDNVAQTATLSPGGATYLGR